MLQTALERRQRLWQPRFELKPPFANLNEVFPPGLLRVTNDTMVGVTAPLPAPYLPERTTRVLAGGDAQLEAVFDHTWQWDSRLGLRFQGDTSNRYEFVLAARPYLPAVQKLRRADHPLDFGYARETDQVADMALLKNNVVLQQRVVDLRELPAQALRLSATREGNRLSFQVNDLPPLSFEDIFPIPGTDAGVFGLYLPSGVRLKTLRAFHQPLSSAPSALERGDALYSQGRYAEGLTFFREHSATAGGGETGQEARYKEALCLLNLKRHAEAQERLGQVLGEDGKRWPLLAGSQLWALLLQQKNPAEAEAVAVRLESQIPLAQLAGRMPHETFQQISLAYRATGRGLNYLKSSPQKMHALERAWALGADAESAEERAMSRGLMVNGYLSTGQEDLALRFLLEELQTFNPDRSPFVEGWKPYALHPVENCAALYRLKGDVSAAMSLLNRWIEKAPGVRREAMEALLLERAACHIRSGDWTRAEKDVQDCQAVVVPEMEKHNHRGLSVVAASWLMRGFLLQERGDTNGARQAWNEGATMVRQRGVLREIEQSDTTRIGLRAGLYSLSLLGMANQLSAPDVENFMTAFFQTSQNASLDSTQTQQYMRLLPVDQLAATMIQGLQSERGRALCRRLAFRQLSFRESLDGMFQMLIHSFLAAGALPPNATAGQQAEVEELARRVGQAYATEKLNDFALAQLFLTWKGTTGFLGWGGLAPSLAPELRGPLAYVFGLRFLKLGRPADARTFFQSVLQDVPSGSRLAGLAKAELTRLKP
jgi:tetratricopeptide (TPR) repeat protein